MQGPSNPGAPKGRTELASERYKAFAAQFATFILIVRTHIMIHPPRHFKFSDHYRRRSQWA